MNFDSREVARIVRYGFGVAFLVLCLGIDLHRSQDRALTRVGDSINAAFSVIDEADGIIDGLDRLSLTQHVFLHTHDPHFSGDLYQSLTTVQKNMEALRGVARKNFQLRDSVSRLDQDINLELALLRNAGELDKSKGPAEAIPLLEKQEIIEIARTEAEHLRLLATEGAWERVRTERQMKSMIDLLF